MRSYDPKDWFWIVAGDESRIYASARQAYAGPEDEAYAAFLAAGHAPTKIASEAELADVLAAHGRSLRAGEAPRILSKLSIVDRLSDAELETFIGLRDGTAATAAALGAADQIRLALRWDNAAEIDRLAADVRQGFAAVFGTARMMELLG